MTDLASRLAAAGTDPAALRAVALADTGAEASSQDGVKARETAITSLCDVLATAGDADGLASLLTGLMPLFGAFPKARAAKVVRGVIDAIARVPGSEALQVCVGEGWGGGGWGGRSPSPHRAAWRVCGGGARRRGGRRAGRCARVSEGAGAHAPVHPRPAPADVSLWRGCACLLACRLGAERGSAQRAHTHTHTHAIAPQRVAASRVR